MQMIHDAISPERLEQAKKLFEQEAKPSSEKVAADLSDRLRKIADLEAEIADRSVFEKNKVSTK
jgi:hypothetical protein